MEQRQFRSTRRSIFWPLLFIIAGLILLASNLNLINGSGWEVVWRLWPLILIIGGIDHIFRGSHYVGPTVMVGIGMVILLNNLGYLNFSWQILLGLWPVLLIALGLDILIGRRHAWGAVIGLVLGILLIAGVVWLVVSVPWIGQVSQIENLSQPANEAQQGSLVVNPVIGALQVSGGAEPDNLVNAQIRHFPNETIETKPYVVQDKIGYYQIKSHGFYIYPVSAATTNTPNWSVKLSSKLPTALYSNLVIGDQELNLAQTKVTQLDSLTVMGRLVVTIPQDGLVHGNIRVVMGQMVINVPRGADIRIKTNTVIVPISIPPDFKKEGNLIFNPNPTSTQPVDFDISDIIGSVTVQYEYLRKNR